MEEFIPIKLFVSLQREAEKTDVKYFPQSRFICFLY